MWTLSPLWRLNDLWHHGHIHCLDGAASDSTACGGPKGLPSLVEYGTPAGCTVAKKRLSAILAACPLLSCAAAALSVSLSLYFHEECERRIIVSHGLSSS
eukprot:1063438-Pyramimonas_sp.AAC.1